MFALESTQNMKSISVLGVSPTRGNLALFKEVLPTMPIEGLTYVKPNEKGGKKV